MDNTCRLCLNESPEAIEELIEGCEVLEKLSKCLSHNISITEELPNKVCQLCICKVDDIHTFHVTIKQNEIILQEKLNLIKSITVINNIKQENYLNNDNKHINQELVKEEKLVIPINLKTEYQETTNIIYSQKDTLNKSNTGNLLKNIDPDKTEHRIITPNEPYNTSNDNITLKKLKENKNSITGLVKVEESRFKCLTCFEVFSNQKELLRHYQTVELDRYNASNIDIDERTDGIRYKAHVSDDGSVMYKCERCFKKYVHKAYIERHIKSHIEKRPFLCKLCGKTYQTASIIVAHGKMHAGATHACALGCGYRSVHKHVVKDHEKRHRREFKFKCDTCGKGFQVKTSYEQHQNIHKGIKPFSCEICGMTFHLHKYLTTHRSNVHPQSSARKPWMCKQCSLPCDSKNSLNIHLKEKHGIIVKVSILCDICGKVVRDTQQLKSHQRSVHLNIKPYTCSVCNKAFPKKFTLKVHEQTHTGKLYACNKCDKKFSRQSSLQRHLQRFHMGSKYKCQKCEKNFTSKEKLTTHIEQCSKNTSSITT